MARQDDHIRHTVRVPRDIYERVANLPGEGSINAKIVNTLDAAGSGKTLRDEFAMAALNGMLAAGDFAYDSDLSAADSAYLYADAMLSARQKGGA